MKLSSWLLTICEYFYSDSLKSTIFIYIAFVFDFTRKIFLFVLQALVDSLEFTLQKELSVFSDRNS